MQPPDILACNSSNKPSFQNLTKRPLAQWCSNKSKECSDIF